MFYLKTWDELANLFLNDGNVSYSDYGYKITSDDDKSTVKMYLPEVDKEDIRVEVEGDTLLVSVIKDGKPSFKKGFTLATQYDRIESESKNGVLYVNIYKKAKKSTKIPIK